MGRHISCPKCNSIGVVPIRPRSEWTNDIEAHFAICGSCNGLGRIPVEQAARLEEDNSDWSIALCSPRRLA
jgi:hypothetical protein